MTWASSSTPCEPFVPCKGEVATRGAPEDKKGILANSKPIVCNVISLIFSGDMGDWSEWSKCSADCSLGEPFGEETRQRTLREGLLENQEPEIETRPCREFCKPGKAELEIEEKNFFLPRLLKN